MNRIETLTGTCIALLAVAGVGQLYLDRKSPVQPAPAQEAQPQEAPKETKTVTADEVIAGALADFDKKTEPEKLAALKSLTEELEGKDYKTAAFSPESTERLVKAVAEAVGQDGGSEDASETQEQLVAFVASRTRGDAAKEFVFKVLDEGPEGLRSAAVDGIGSPHGISGRSVFAKIQELAGKGLIDEETLPDVLRRTGGKKSAEPILAAIRSTDSWRAISAGAVALQDLGDAEVMGSVMERLDQTGLLDDSRRMPWISPKLLSIHMEKAEGTALKRGIKAVKSRPSLIKSCAQAVERGLDSGDAETRRLSAETIRIAVVAKRYDAQKAEGLLAGRLGKESEPVLKAELTGGIEQVRKAGESQPLPQGVPQ